MKIDDRNFEKRIQSKLAEHEVAVRDDLWAAIESQLPKGEPARKISLHRRVWWYSAAAVAAGAVLTLALWQTPEQRLDTTTVSQRTPVQTEAQSPHIQASEANEKPLLATTRISHHTLLREQKVTDNTTIDRSTLPMNKTAREIESATPTRSTPVESKSSHPAIATAPSDSTATPTREAAYRRQLDEFEQAGRALKEGYVTDNTPITRTKNPGIRLGLMAANASTGSSPNGPTAIRTRNPLMLAKRDPVYQFKHKMPISAGVTVSKSLPRNWELESGLVYTYLYSKYYSTKGNGSQELHYLGIPLNVIYRFARIKRLSFYASAGGQVDFYLAGRQKDEEHDGAVSGSGYKELKHENVQFSVQANVGAALTLYKAVELYLEPYMAYYFENNSSIHNIWKDKPFNFGLTLGIRTGF